MNVDEKKLELLDTVYYEQDKAEIIASLESDEKKLELLSVIKDEYAKFTIIASLKSDEKKLELLDTIFEMTESMSLTPELVLTLKSDEKKLELLDKLDLDYNGYREDIIASLESDKKKLEMLDYTTGEYARAKIMASLKSYEGKLENLKSYESMMLRFEEETFFSGSENWQDYEKEIHLIEADSIASLKSDEEKLELLEYIKYEEAKAKIIASLKSDEKKLELLESIEEDVDKAKIIASLKSDEKKLELLESIEEDVDKAEIIASLNSDEKKLEMIETVDGQQAKLKIIVSLESNEKKLEMMETRYSGIQERFEIILSLKPEEKEQDRDNADDKERRNNIKSFSMDELEQMNSELDERKINKLESFGDENEPEEIKKANLMEEINRKIKEHETLQANIAKARQSTQEKPQQ